MINKLLNKLIMCSNTELYTLCYRDMLTGLHNRRAFDTVSPHYSHVAIIDVDSLKYVNDKLGHHHGDALLILTARLLSVHFSDDECYRLHGDEFAVVSNDPTRLNRKLAQIQNRFSYGIGSNLASADVRLSEDKFNRLQRGERVERGVKPQWLN